MATSKKKPAKVHKKKPTRTKPTARATATAKKARPKTASGKSRTAKRSKTPARKTRSKKAPSAKATAVRQVRARAETPKTRGVPIKALGGHLCDLVLDEDCARDAQRADIDRAITSFLALEPSALTDVEEHVFRYYLDGKDDLEPGEPGYLEIGRASDVWKHVQFGAEATVGREGNGVYISLGCNCDWEQEHGLQIVFKDGQRVNKVGPFDGHFTNSHAYDDPSLENVVYRPRTRA
jgi:hypothetical protein